MKWQLILLIGLIPIVGSTQVDNVLSSKFSITQNGSTLTMPYGSSHPIDIPDADIKYLVFSIHGVNRNADDYYDRMIAARDKAGEDGDSTLIISPQFLTETDIVAYSLGSEYLYWSSGGWIAGSNSRNEASNPRPERIPSYQMLDEMIMSILNDIPTIQVITIVGHSAGAQLVQRYAASSTLSSIQDWFQMRFIVMNPSSYVYLDSKRRVGGSVDQFAMPSTSCSDYNEWKYGLEDLFTYTARQSMNAIRSTYKSADVTYLLGGNDNDPNSANLDLDCAAQLQGGHRLERGTIYYNHLKDHYGQYIHQIDTVFGVGHSSSEMFSSEEGVRHIFEMAQDNTTSTRPHYRELGSLSVSPNPTNDWIRIKRPTQKFELIDYRIYDMAGRLHWSAQSRGDIYDIDISNLTLGVYLIQGQIGLEVFQEKIIKL